LGQKIGEDKKKESVEKDMRFKSQEKKNGTSVEIARKKGHGVAGEDTIRFKLVQGGQRT